MNAVGIMYTSRRNRDVRRSPLDIFSGLTTLKPLIPPRRTVTSNQRRVRASVDCAKAVAFDSTSMRNERFQGGDRRSLVARAAHAAGVMDDEVVCVERQSVQAGEFLEIDVEDRFQLALVDAAALEARSP